MPDNAVTQEAAVTHAEVTRDEHENLRREVEHLRTLLAQLAPAPVPGAAETTAISTAGAPLSRRGLLRALPAAAVVGVGVTAGSVALAQPAAAASGQPLLLGVENDANAVTTTLLSAPLLSTVHPGGVDANEAYTQIAPASIDLVNGPHETHFAAALVDLVSHVSSEQPMLQVSAAGTGGDEGSGSFEVGTVGGGHAFAHVRGYEYSYHEASGTDALRATALAARAVTGIASSAINYHGEYEDIRPGTALAGVASENSLGLSVTSESGRAVSTSTTSTTTTTDAVVLDNAGLGRTVLATSSNSKNNAGTLTGVTKGTGSAVWGTIDNDASTAPAVVGWAGAKGRGGKFKGGAAAINLAPSTAANHPPTGATGDLFLDSTARLWLCKGGSTWSQLG